MSIRNITYWLGGPARFLTKDHVVHISSGEVKNMARNFYEVITQCGETAWTPCKRVKRKKNRSTNQQLDNRATPTCLGCIAKGERR
jgi:hypothetical protein